MDDDPPVVPEGLVSDDPLLEVLLSAFDALSVVLSADCEGWASGSNGLIWLPPEDGSKLPSACVCSISAPGVAAALGVACGTGAASGSLEPPVKSM